MSDALVISTVALWIAVVVLGLIVWALTRQVGVLLERVNPAGALVTNPRLQPGQSAPALELTALDGKRLAIGGPSPHGRSTLIFFLSPTCPVCDALLPAVRSLARTERDWLDIVLASDGVDADHGAFVERKRLAPLPYVLSTELGLRLHVAQLPYAVLIDQAGTIASMGITNTREHLESVLEAKLR